MTDQEIGTRLVVQNSIDRPGSVYLALSGLARGDLISMRAAVAYVTLAGSTMLFDHFLERLLLRWQRVDKKIVTSFDYGLTEPDALTYLQEHQGMEVRIANADVIERQALIPEHAFHAKAYLFEFEGADARTEAVIGSANLTQRALTVNDELMTVSVHGSSDEAIEDAWIQLFDQASILTPELLEEYRAVRARAMPPPLVEDSVETPPIGPETRELFWDAVEFGEANPEEAVHFWIEAGSMSSGGSNNQLELPRGANRYFGHDFRDYTDGNELMGTVYLDVRGARHVRELKWHGNNRMERIYLPTVQQGGYRYADSVVLFTATDDAFTMNVAPRQSALASGWINASLLRRSIFRIGANTSRLCGMF